MQQTSTRAGDQHVTRGVNRDQVHKFYSVYRERKIRSGACSQRQIELDYTHAPINDQTMLRRRPVSGEERRWSDSTAVAAGPRQGERKGEHKERATNHKSSD